MGETRDVLAEIRRDLENYVGKRVRVRANKGRRRIVEREGTLEKTYPNLFVIKLDEQYQNRRVSYTYADLLTAMVEVSVFTGKEPKKLQYSASSAS
ncbi:MAG TPA: Veg family protein [Thermaerobacter sp.]